VDSRLPEVLGNACTVLQKRLAAVDCDRKVKEAFIKLAVAKKK
jgi:hypothetical protein